jgi:glycosyltransferase involved in cell wall biosynthesis
MKILLLYDYPPPPGGLATQGDLLYRGLIELGVDAHAAHFESPAEKEWYYRWFKPDIVLGVGYWGHSPHIILHPQNFGQRVVPWLVADGYIANYQDILNDLALILVTSNWVREVYIRDGIRGDHMEVLPVGCNTEDFIPRSQTDPRVSSIRQAIGVSPDEVLLLTIGGDAASKGAQEVMKALARLSSKADIPPWKYVCKVWPQLRTVRQNQVDLDLARQLGIADRVIFFADRVSRDLMPYLIAACDIYAAPSRLEGFGMPQVEAGACGKPVISIAAMAMLDTLVHQETAFLAKVGLENRISEVLVGAESGYEEGRRIYFDPPRIVDYRVDDSDLAVYLELLMKDPELRSRMGEAGRQRVVERYDYRIVAKQFIDLVSNRMGLE